MSGSCNFQEGLCGLQNDINSEFQWTVGFGTTPSEDTGPLFDHTTLSNEGIVFLNFIYFVNLKK